MASKPSKKYYTYEESHRTVNGVKQKRCAKCQKWKEESEFTKTASSKDGLAYQCRQCDRKQRREIRRKEGKSLKRHYTYRESHRVVDGVKQKRCRRCRMWKAESEFYRRHRHKDGLAVWCKECSYKAVRKSRERRLAVRN